MSIQPLDLQIFAMWSVASKLTLSSTMDVVEEGNFDGQG